MNAKNHWQCGYWQALDKGAEKAAVEVAADNETIDWKKIIIENEKCRIIGVNLSDHQWEKIIDSLS